MNLTDEQRANLDKLATYLEQLPKGYRRFGMATFVDGSDSEAVVEYALHNGGVHTCGTAACAIGHGPSAGILVPFGYINASYRGVRYVDWDGYASLYVPDFDAHSDWCFGGAWTEADNSRQGAAARIRYLLKHGAPPEGYRLPNSNWRKVYAPYRIDAKATS